MWNLGSLAGAAHEEAPEADRDPHKDQKAALVRSNYMNCQWRNVASDGAKRALTPRLER